MKKSEKAERVKRANEFISVIASCGRKFFSHNGRVSRIEIDQNGRMWFVDAYRESKIYIAYNGRWSGFSEGGTLRSLVIQLRKYILGEDFAFNLSHPSWWCGGDPWGYGDDMETIRTAAKSLI